MLFGEDGDLIDYLKTIASVTAFVGTGTAARIYWEEARQNAALPYLVLTSGDGESHRHVAGLAGVRKSTVHCYCHADLPSASESLAEAVRLAFGETRQRMTIGDTFVNWAIADVIDSGTDPQQAGSDVRRYWRRVLIELQHSESKS